MSESLAGELTEALDRSAAQLETGWQDEGLAAGLELLAAALAAEAGNDGVAQKRQAALVKRLSGIVGRLR